MTRPTLEGGGDDLRLDAVWLAVERGDVEGAARAAAAVEAPGFAERARLDALTLAEGRAAALQRARAEGPTWLAARFSASDTYARAVLDAVPSDERGLAFQLEVARLSAPGRRVALAGALVASGAGGPEARALLVETLVAQGRHGAAEAALADAPPSARLRAARHRLELATGRVRTAARGLLDDLRAGRLGASGLQLLERTLLRVPMRQLEDEARALLRADTTRGERWERARSRLLAQLELRAGHVREGVATLAALDVPDPVDERLARRVRLRALPGETGGEPSPEERVDADPGRTRSPALAELRLAEAWGLAARTAYRDMLLDDERVGLDAFVRRLDEAAARLGVDVPRLGELPRRGFGVFGEMLDVTPLAAALPGAFVLAGQGFLLPAELTLYDRVASVPVEVPADGDGPVRYRRELVRNLRVPGWMASQGAEFSGAGLVDVVFLDVDQVVREARRRERPLAASPLEAWTAADTAARRSLDEPLETVERLLAAARADAGDDWTRRVLEVLALHEERHIVDVQRLLARSAFGMLVDVLGAGVTPAAVRAEVERRAQLDALRHATDPRLPLALVVASVAGGDERGGEHAAGYRALLAELVEVLDEERWEGARPLAELGLDRGRVLVQQLWRLEPATLRALAEAVGL